MDTLEAAGLSFGRPSKDDRLSFLTFLLDGAADDECSSTIGSDGGDCSRVDANGSVVEKIVLLDMIVVSGSGGDKSEYKTGRGTSRGFAETAE